MTSEGPRFFGVVSWGCAATAWLSRALNAHPDICCVHDRGDGWALPLPEHPSSLAKRFGGSIGYAAVGEVHGISREVVPELQQQLGSRFSAAVVVREPLARLWSQVSLFREHAFSRWGTLEYIDTIAAAAGLDSSNLSIDQRHFLHGCNMLNAILLERDIAPIFRSEDLTGDPERLRSFAQHLTQGAVDYSADLATSMQAAAVNRHARSKAVWSADEKRLMAAVVKPEAWEAYRELGYPPPQI